MPTGRSVEAFQVHLGGSLGGNARLGPQDPRPQGEADDLTDYVERVARRYLDGRESADESFAHWAHRVDEEALR